VACFDWDTAKAGSKAVRKLSGLDLNFTVLHSRGVFAVAHKILPAIQARLALGYSV